MYFPWLLFSTTIEPFSFQCFWWSHGDGGGGGRSRRPSWGGFGTRSVRGVSSSNNINNRRHIIFETH